MLIALWFQHCMNIDDGRVIMVVIGKRIHGNENYTKKLNYSKTNFSIHFLRDDYIHQSYI